jgi:hypothetical protein
MLKYNINLKNMEVNLKERGKLEIPMRNSEDNTKMDLK